MVARNYVEAPAEELGFLDDGEALDREEPPLTDDEILSICTQEIQLSTGWNTTSKISEQRRLALRYYMGDLYGDEVAGRSQVVTTEFRDTVESLLPQLMKIFTASDQVVQYVPNNPSQEAASMQATEYVNHLFMQKNSGFIVLYTMMKDALMYKNGIAKTYWEPETVVTTETYEGLSEMERDALLQDPEVEPTAYDAEQVMISPGVTPEGLMLPAQPVTICNLTLRRTETKGRLRVLCVPPEEFMITQQSSDIQTARFVGHRCRKTVSELIEMGVPKDVAERLIGDAEGEIELDRMYRFSYDGDTNPLSESADKATQYVWITECYILLDMDGDGVAERWKITIGNTSEIIFKEEWEGDWPFASISPHLMQHKFYGLSVFDIVQQWQRIQTTLTRQFLDNIYSLNNNRIAVNADRVNLDDLLTNRPNSLVRTIGNPAEVLMPMQPSPLGAVLIPSLEYFNAQREKATGVTSYNQGLDSDSLNKTASGINQIMNAAQERILLIARIFAETGISEMFQQMLKLVCKHQNKEEVIRMRGKWVTVDPSTWASDMAATTDVALGTNNRDQMLLHLNQVLVIQQQAMQAGSTLVTPKNIYNTLVKLVENTGLKHPETYFTDPDSVPPPQPKPSPEEILLQGQKEIEGLKSQTTLQKTQIETSASAQEKLAALQHEQQRAARESADRAAERENKLQIAREANLTSLVETDLKSISDTQQTETKEKSKASVKKKPIELTVVRDPQTREITGIRPVYEEIMDVAEEGTVEYSTGKGKIPL